MGFKSEDAYTAELQTVLQFALALRNAAGVSPSFSPVTNNLQAVVDSINLPNPRPLLPSLLEAGFNHEMATSISEAYRLRAEDLKQRIQESITTACREIAELPVVTSASSPDELMKKLAPTLTEFYLRRLEQWKDDIVGRIQQARKAPILRNSRTFNQEYVPLLEHFFEENPFPTHADKMLLAMKSKMEYRQIHVWFQNRRNRTKREGKSFTKKPKGATKPLDKSYQRMKAHVIHPDSQASSLSTAGPSEGAAKDDMSKDAFASPSPPHAFPLSYPPTCHYDPFPCKSGPVQLSKPEWRRMPDRKQPASLSTHINELIEKFSHLTVRDGTRANGSFSSKSHAATVAITVIPSHAPHPSLVVRKYSQPTSMIQLRPPTRASISCSEAFKSPSSSKPVTLVPLSAPHNKSELSGKRKIASLPRRSPGRQYNACRDTTPSENSSTSSPSPHLFSADSESTRSFSSVSLLSTPSDAVTVQELPHLFGSPPCRSSFNSPIHLRGLGNAVAISL